LCMKRHHQVASATESLTLPATSDRLAVGSGEVVAWTSDRLAGGSGEVVAWRETSR
jgi:hypothetical protein